MTSNKTPKQQLGTKGENIACDYLETKGYTILRKNYKAGYHEIDIICQKNRFLVFIEVKTRSSVSFGMPEQHLSKQQEKNITNAAIRFTDSQKFDQLPLVRYDIISIVFQGLEYKLSHFQDAFH
ncbi:YraN family protein [Flammeovirga pacifica]|uniref:UPF0102 protein NH26_05360 n=1 Tax=Flammeovirga pacifica TaxID=915059 RepID=A0A1S1YXT4_FLAPC|nr:YraN family protein [Flammeovirga pacifica]OHX65817.1 hypothetical protein NH26_05360 [Flammeovirga pacifica]